MTSIPFTAQAIHDKRGDNDPSGMLYLTDARALFISDVGVTPVSWKKVVSASRDGNELRIVRTDRQTPTVFSISPLLDTMKAELVAVNLLEQSRVPKGSDA